MDTSEVRHPGERIKAEVFPAKMSVTKAAELIGVGRPALSNLLNGKVSSLPIWRLASRRHSDSQERSARNAGSVRRLQS